MLNKLITVMALKIIIIFADSLIVEGSSTSEL